MDILRLPVVGPFLRWRHARRLLQCVLLAVAALVVLHGLGGPQVAPRNWATVLTSIHWRGLLVIAPLLLGNLFCTACPMVLARDVGRRLVSPRFSWPRPLRRKWIALGLLLAVLFAYELFGVWARPSATAWLVLGYFGLAIAVDLLFRNASFCKYICPIGQFNFVLSTLAPTELRVRDIQTCRSCRTSDCIKGRPAAPLRIVQRGCELGLFLPSKVGNLDCTLCLDCVHACPHDNIGLVTRLPGLELLETQRRSGIGRLADRPDIAALMVVLAFAASISAFAMTAPAIALERMLATLFRVKSEAVLLAMIFATALVAMPAALAAGAAALTRLLAGDGATPIDRTARRFAVAFAPIGFGMWLAHFGFHLLTGAMTAVPVTQSAAIDLLGWAALGEPAWRWVGMQPGSVYPLQLGVVFLGTGGSLGLVRAIAVRDYPPERAIRAAVPWVAMIVALAAFALWILNQPMEMRGLGIG